MSEKNRGRGEVARPEGPRAEVGFLGGSNKGCKLPKRGGVESRPRNGLFQVFQLASLGK